MGPNGSKWRRGSKFGSKWGPIKLILDHFELQLEFKKAYFGPFWATVSGQKGSFGVNLAWAQCSWVKMGPNGDVGPNLGQKKLILDHFELQ